MPRWLFIHINCIYILAWALRCSFLQTWQIPGATEREAGNNAGLHAFFYVKDKDKFQI